MSHVDRAQEGAALAPGLGAHNIRVIEDRDEVDFYIDCYLRETPSERSWLVPLLAIVSVLCLSCSSMSTGSIAETFTATLAASVGF